MSFAQIYRAFKGYQQRHEQQETLTREVAYLIYAQVGRKPLQPKGVFWPIGDIEDPGVTQEYTDMIYAKYGKLHGKN